MEWKTLRKSFEILEKAKPGFHVKARKIVVAWPLTSIVIFRGKFLLFRWCVTSKCFVNFLWLNLVAFWLIYGSVDFSDCDYRWGNLS